MTAEPNDIAALTATRMIEQFDYDVVLAESVVLVYDAGLVPSKSVTRRHRRSRHPFRHVGTLSDGVDIVVASGPGAPVAAITVEFLAALGVSRIIAVGSAGYLSRDGKPPPHPSCVISHAESDEGTSQHYHHDLTADAELTSALSGEVSGPTQVALTTDVPFRHTSHRLAAHRQRADVVEMECAALFAAAHRFGIAAAALLVLSDIFDDDQWRYLAMHEDSNLAEEARDSAHRVLAMPR